MQRFLVQAILNVDLLVLNKKELPVVMAELIVEDSQHLKIGTSDG